MLFRIMFQIFINNFTHSFIFISIQFLSALFLLFGFARFATSDRICSPKSGVDRCGAREREEERSAFLYREREREREEEKKLSDSTKRAEAHILQLNLPQLNGESAAKKYQIFYISR